MLITQGFGWIALFNAWAFLIPVGVFFASMIIQSIWENHRAKKGKPVVDDPDNLGVHGAITVISIICLPIMAMAFFLGSPGPHYSVIESDIETQFSLQHVDHKWIEEEKEYKYTAKDPEGKFVMCNTEETKSEDTFILKCDSGKDYQKEGTNDFK